MAEMPLPSIQLSAGFWTHPKYRKIANRLGVRVNRVHAFVARLWALAGQHDPSGVFTPETLTDWILEALDYAELQEVPAEKMAALLQHDDIRLVDSCDSADPASRGETGMVEFHNWLEHTGYHYASRRGAAARQRRSREKRAPHRAVTVTEPPVTVTKPPVTPSREPVTPSYSSNSVKYNHSPNSSGADSNPNPALEMGRTGARNPVGKKTEVTPEMAAQIQAEIAASRARAGLTAAPPAAVPAAAVPAAVEAGPEAAQ